METDIDNVEVGIRIKRIRTENGMTAEKFGELFNPPASKGTVSKWENGRYLPNNERLVVIAEKGKISVEELLYGSSVKSYIINLLSNDEEYNYDDPIQKKATDDTISCFDDTNLTNEEMDVVSVYLQNLKYHETNSGYRIHNKESYIEYLKIMNEALKISLDNERITKEAERQIKEAERFEGYQPPAMEDIISNYKMVYHNYIESNQRLIDRLNRKD